MIAAVLSIIYTHFLHIQYYSDYGNPYDPNDNGQFKLPVGILDDAHDVYGQINGTHLNTVLEYGDTIGGNNGIQTTSSGRPEFSNTLNEKIKKSFILNSINVQIKIYQECVEDISKRVDDWNAVDYPRCVGCKFILVHILLNPYLRTLHSHLMLYHI